MRDQFRDGNTPERYAAVVGTIAQNSERPITGRSGDHLQFYLQIGNGMQYQIDVNTQSSDGSNIEVYIADQDIDQTGTNPGEPFGAPAYGVFPDAHLSYAAMGLTDADFAPMAYYRIDGQLSAALNTASFVTVYGMSFDDGGSNGKGVHDTHYNPEDVDQDGAIAIYWLDPTTNAPKRSWFFFKFQDETIPADDGKGSSA
jgi:hypothetical protein